jgi:retron-type reverse transcriptase
MIERILTRKNLLKARRQVEKNRGSSGVDGMPVGHLKSYLDQTREPLLTSILNQSYVAQPILGVEIPKEEGKTRLLGVPTVIDRMLQQAASSKSSDSPEV